MASDFFTIGNALGTRLGAIAKTLKSKTTKLLGVYQDWDSLDFGGATPNAINSSQTSGAESSDIDCEGKSTIILKIEYSANNVTAPIRIILKGANANVGRAYSEQITPANTTENDEILETGYYHGEAVVVPAYGAKTFVVVLVGTPTNSGYISVWGKGV